MPKRVTLVAAVFLLHMALAIADTPPLVGEYQFYISANDSSFTFTITSETFSFGGPGCTELKYTVVKPPFQGWNGTVYVIEIHDPQKKCGSTDKRKQLYIIEISSNGSASLDTCPTDEDLRLFLEKKNRYCSGTWVGTRKGK